MFAWLGRWLGRAFLVLAAAVVAAFIVDSVVYFAHGSPSSTVTVNKFMGVPLKDQKEEYDYLGPVEMPCAVALFPHQGLEPCWYLRRNTNQWENL